MKNPGPVIIVLILFSLLPNKNISGCSVFVFNNKDSIVAGKNLDWSVCVGYLIVNKKGVLNHGMVNNSGVPCRWVSKFGSVTFNQFGVGMPLGGMNEKGLVVEELSYSPSVYPENQNIPGLNEFQWIQYQLDNYDSVPEVINNLSRIGIIKFIAGLHYFICDRAGDSAVIEFLDGKIVISTGNTLPVKVLTNNTYSKLIKYLRFHKGFGGERVVSKGVESPERFVRIATELKQLKSEKVFAPVTKGFDILYTAAQKNTQWSIIYNLSSSKIYFRTKCSNRLKSLDLNKVDFKNGIEHLFIDINEKEMNEISVNDMSALSLMDNYRLINKCLEKLLILKELDNTGYSEILERLTIHFKR